MKLQPRRAVLMDWAHAVGALATGPTRAQAAYPTQPIKFAFRRSRRPADTVARIMGRWLQEKVGQSGDREQARRQRRGFGRGVDELAAGRHRVHHPGRLDLRHQPAHLRQDGLQHRRSDADYDDRPGPDLSRRAPKGAGQDDERVHRLREGQPRQAQLRLVRRRLHASSVDGGAGIVALRKLDSHSYRGTGQSVPALVGGHVQVLFSAYRRWSARSKQEGQVLANNGSAAGFRCRTFRRSPRLFRATIWRPSWACMGARACRSRSSTRSPRRRSPPSIRPRPRSNSLQPASTDRRQCRRFRERR